MTQDPAGSQPLEAAAVPTTPAPAAAGRRQGDRVGGAGSFISSFARWEVLLLVMLAVIVWWGAQISPYFIQPDFWNSANFGASISGTMEVAIMALAMTPIIITGEIDLSVESMVGLSSCVL